VINIEFIESLGTVTPHEKKSLSVTSSSELFMKGAYFSCENEWGALFEAIYSIVDLRLVFIYGHL